MNIKAIVKKAVIPCTSALLGAAAAVVFFKMSPTAQAKMTDVDIFKHHENIQSRFDSLFNDDFFGQSHAFEEMKKMRQQMQNRMDIFSFKNADSWFSDKSGAGSVNEISKREDENFVYYDIKVGDPNSASINTKIENGYISITGTQENKTAADSQNDNSSVQSIFKSSFSRTFPLPDNVDQAKMQMLNEKDKIVLKFPKIT